LIKVSDNGSGIPASRFGNAQEVSEVWLIVVGDGQPQTLKQCLVEFEQGFVQGLFCNVWKDD
jgi:hypothetical protein